MDLFAWFGKEGRAAGDAPFAESTPKTAQEFAAGLVDESHDCGIEWHEVSPRVEATGPDTSDVPKHE
jgi:hypothetical protein